MQLLDMSSQGSAELFIEMNKANSYLGYEFLALVYVLCYHSLASKFGFYYPKNEMINHTNIWEVLFLCLVGSMWLI